MEKIYSAQPNYLNEIEKGFEAFNRRKNNAASRQMTVTIPVHVIIVHDPGNAIGQGNNLSDDHVFSQIDVLNEDFGRYNSDAGNTPSSFPAADTGIQFCLATVDPNGGATNGITRYSTSLNFDNNEETIKNATRWPRDNYLNIWVAELDGVLGFAYLPTPSSLPNESFDGVAVGTPYFGGPGYATGNPYHLGRTATHEVGHFLGLRHVWRSGGCGADDGISDTPLQDDENYGCPTHPSTSCGNSGDMFMNYMDYVNDNCMNAFTVEQGNYMNNILSTSRASLANSAGFACAAPDPLSLQLDDSKDPSCYLGFDGYIHVSAEGGSGSYIYSLNTGASNNTGIFENLTSGDYIVTVEDGTDVISLNVELIDPDQLEIIEDSKLNNLCFGGNEGAVTVYGLGGTSDNGIYMYQINSENPQSDGMFTNLSNGSYQFTVIDANQCTASSFIEITSPSIIESMFMDTVEITCFGDSTGGFSVLSSGGIAPYTYSIGNGFQMENTFNDLPAGEYILQVKDGNDCIHEDTLQLSQLDSLITMFTDVMEITCQGSSTAGFTLVSTGGNNIFEYAINGNTIDSNFVEELVAAQYIVTTTDTNGCSRLDTILFTDPDFLSMQILDISQPICQEDPTGFLEVQASGGMPPYTYEANGVENTDGIFTMLLPGDYQVSVTDARECVSTILASLPSNPEIESTFDVLQPSCFGASDGSININASGGSGGYSYQVNNGTITTENTLDNLEAGMYSVTIIDQIGCSATYDIEIDEVEELIALTTLNVDECGVNRTWTIEMEISGGNGTYQATYAGETINVSENIAIYNGNENESGVIEITDQKGCLVEVDFDIELPTPIASSTTILTPASCDGTTLGSVQLSLSGGTPPYTFFKNGIEYPNGLINDLEAGFHQATGIDNNGCEHLIEFSIPTDVEGFEIASIEKLDVSCFGESDGSLNVNVQGNQGMLTYVLNGTSNDDGIFENLDAGEYNIEVIDNSNNCILTSTAVIIEPDELEGEIEITYGSYEGENKIEISPTGGTPPYLFALDNVDVTQESPFFYNLKTQNYSVFIIDDNGCVYEEAIGLTSTVEPELKYNLNLYPNPTANDINIELNVEQPKDFSIELLDITGKKAMHFPKITFSTINKKLTFSVKDLNSSIYIVKIASGNEIMYRKVLVR